MKKILLIIIALFLIVGCTKEVKNTEKIDPLLNVEYSSENWTQKINTKYGIEIKLPDSVLFESVERKDGTVEEYDRIEVMAKCNSEFKTSIKELVNYLFELTKTSSAEGNYQVDYKENNEFLFGDKIENPEEILSLGEEYAFADWLFGTKEDINYIRVEYEDNGIIISLRKK